MRSRLTIWLLSIAATMLVAGEAAAATSLPTQTSSRAGVTVAVTPRNLGSGTWEFEVAMNTHSQELSDDFEKSAVLLADGRTSHAPLKWLGDPPGGHHRKGVLRFKPLSPPPAALELQLRRPAENAPRSFRWKLN